MEDLEKEHERLEREVSQVSAANSQLEEHIASMITESREAEKQKQWVYIFYFTKKYLMFLNLIKSASHYISQTAG